MHPKEIPVTLNVIGCPLMFLTAPTPQIPCLRFGSCLEGSNAKERQLKVFNESSCGKY